MFSTPPVDAVTEMAVRLLGQKVRDFFLFLPLETSNDYDCFEITPHAEAPITIKGNSGPALTSGLHYYLTHYAHLSISWQRHKPEPLEKFPIPSTSVRRESWARWRYFLNYCCYSYSVAFWNWEQWEHLIDWMALRGVNLPLMMTGQESVWQRVCYRLGLSNEETRSFLPGAAYLPFGWMGCLDGWTGPLPDQWIKQHEELGRRILERQRSLGMTPVLQGFTGHVPAAITRIYPNAELHQIRWLEWETYMLSPLDPLFCEIAKLYIEEQSRLFGTDHYYAADPFIEMIPPSGDPTFLAELGSAIYNGMAQSDPKAVWVLQGWPFHYKREFWTQPRLEALLGAIPNDRMLVLDLFCEAHPMWKNTAAFCGKPWLWCNVQNFGANTVLAAALETNNTDLHAARNDSRANRLMGVGMVNEGLCMNAAAYDFLFEQAWRLNATNLAVWGENYAIQRYGEKCSPAATEAWKILATEVLHHFRMEESSITRCPTFPAPQIEMEKLHPTIRAWNLLLTAASELKEVDNYQLDLIHVGRQVFSDLATVWKRKLREAMEVRNLDAFDSWAGKFRTLLVDLARLLASRPEFRLTSWIQKAEVWASNDDERMLLRHGALRQITLWGNSDETVRDYARKEWAGLITGYYLPRWEAWFSFVTQALKENRQPDEATFRRESMEWERSWIHSAQPNDPKQEHPVTVSLQIQSKYAKDFP